MFIFLYYRIGGLFLSTSNLHNVISVRQITDLSYVLRFDKNDFDFLPGQYLSLGIDGDYNMREYSLYSPKYAPYLEILVKEMKDGYLSPRLKKLKEGDKVHVEGPFGYFTLKDKDSDKHYYFIASGTGIAPFHSITLSYPNIKYSLFHGIRYGNESYDREDYTDYLNFTSGDNSGFFAGRITEYIKNANFNSNSYFYLCGNCDMIYSVFDILIDKGVDSEMIFTEVYF